MVPGQIGGNVKVICITGKIGSGKSVALGILEKKGARVLDADKISRDVTLPGSTTLSEIADTFGKEYITNEGALDRKKLGLLVFADRKKLDILENILYNSIKREILDEIAKAENDGIDILAIEAINPFDTRFINIFDEIWVIYCDEDTQMDRVRQRDKLETGEIENIISSQKSFEEYKEIATHLIANNGNIIELENNINKILGEE